ncbi:hypothetical protein J3B02_000790 [Coemansia erecta]|nr:hypothetical protein J3B02_000790 [Coemansia erecta]
MSKSLEQKNVQPEELSKEAEKREDLTEDVTGGSVLSVSGIINSVREQRAASQRKEQRAESRSLVGNMAVSDEEMVPVYYLFNTYELVDKLIDCGFSREQATSMMILVRNQVYMNMSRVTTSMLSRSDLENDAYLFRSALQELRTETQVIRKNDQAILESQAAAISRDIDSLAQKINDEIANLKSDIEIELNNRRHETNHEMKSLDMELHDLASKYQVVVGEMKTGIEAIKLESIRRGLVTAVLTAVIITVIIWAPEIVSRLRKGEKSRDGLNDNDEDSTRTQGRKQQVQRMQQEQIQQHQREQQQQQQQQQQQKQLAEIAGFNTQSIPEKLYPAVCSSDGQVLIQKSDASTSTEDDNSRATARRRFHDHSHLNIRYDPSASPSDGQYDDWFDSFFYSPRSADGPESASLMDSDSRLDSSLLDANVPNDLIKDDQRKQDTSSGNNDKMAEQVVHVPLHFTHQDNRDAADGGGSSASSDKSYDK